MKNKVYIIIAAWNSQDHLSDLFLSLRKMNYPKSKWQLVVVDNGSKDKTKNILLSWQNKMHNFETIIYNTQNEGYARANNQGIQYALKNQADYIVLLNDDTTVEPDWLNIIIKKMEEHKNIGLAQPLITRYPETDKINTFGNSYQYTGFGYCYGEGEMVNSFNIKSYQPAYLSFTAVVIRAQVFTDVGLLDENYFSYHEDTDFCFRARLQNWDLLAIKDSIIHHNYKFPAHKSNTRYFWLEKNRIYLIFKFFKAKTLLLIAPACFLMEFGLVFYSIIRGFFIQRLKAYLWLVKNSAKILKQRRQIQQSRKFGDDKLFNFISGVIEFQEIKNSLLTRIANPILNLYLKIIRKSIT